MSHCAPWWDTLCSWLGLNQPHRIVGQPLLIGTARVLLSHTNCVPSEDGHELPSCSAIVRGNCCASLAETMRSAVAQPGLVAPIPKLVAEAGIGEWSL